MATQGNAVIGQSGGPTSVINQSLVGVVLEMRKHKLVDQLLGARHGVRGQRDLEHAQAATGAQHPVELRERRGQVADVT